MLVIVAAGLVASSLHAAAEAGWIAGGQQQAFDLSWLIAPGTVTASLLTGMLGLQPHPTVLEVTGWLLYAVPMLIFVCTPDRVRPQVRAASAGFAVVAAPVVLLIGVLAGGETAAVLSGASGTGADGARERVGRRAVSRRCCGSRPARRASPSTGTGEYEILDGGRILAEVENLAAGIDGQFSLTLQPGAYTLRCSGARDGRLVVTGAKRAVPGAAGVAAYRRYLETRDGAAGHAHARLRGGAAGGRRGPRARALFASAREPYEAIEPVAESFGDLDPRIDARVNDLDPGQKWTGFHAIEKLLWVKHTTRGTAALADTLEADIAHLQSLVKTVKLEPAQVANGATGLLGEVSKSKVTGEEDRYSHTDLSDFAANVDGAEAAFAAIRPALAKRDAALATLIDGRFKSRRRRARRVSRRERLRRLRRAEPRAGASALAGRRRARGAALTRPGTSARGLRACAKP